MPTTIPCGDETGNILCNIHNTSEVVSYRISNMNSYEFTSCVKVKAVPLATTATTFLKECWVFNTIVVVKAVCSRPWRYQKVFSDWGATLKTHTYMWKHTGIKVYKSSARPLTTRPEVMANTLETAYSMARACLWRLMCLSTTPCTRAPNRKLTCPTRTMLRPIFMRVLCSSREAQHSPESRERDMTQELGQWHTGCHLC